MPFPMIDPKLAALAQQLGAQGQQTMPTLPPNPLQQTHGPVAPPMPMTDPSWFREDGSPKGQGFLGVLKRPDGGVMSEYSIADSEKIRGPQGQYLDYPSIVPTLTPAEVNILLTSRPGDPVPQSIKDKAEAYALKRISENKPMFARTGEMPFRGTK